MRWKGLSLPYTAFDKEQRVSQAAIVENKRLSEVLAFIKVQQDMRAPPRVKTNSEKSGYLKRTGHRRRRPCGAELRARERGLIPAVEALR